MLPAPNNLGEESGIRRVVEAYRKHLPAFGVEFVSTEDEADVTAAHIDGADIKRLDVYHSHGLYWTADYRDTPAWAYEANGKAIESARRARLVTVPSDWVAESFRRDMRLSPEIVGHGIEWQDWQERPGSEGYVLWNKNRKIDVCSPKAVKELAARRPGVRFAATFYPDTFWPPNVQVFGVTSHEQMGRIVRRARTYLSTAKETFGIGVLEAMASGVPVLAWRQGGAAELVQHGVSGYLARPGDWDDLERGLDYCQQHREVLGENGRELSKEYTWERVAEQLAGLYAGLGKAATPTVGVVIPCYNYGTEEKLGRAIRSCLSQTYAPEAIVIVNDGSTEGDPDGVVRDIRKTQPGIPIRFVNQNHGGVAAARNRGISETSAGYVCCLDADDAIEPKFLQMCVEELERDPALGIAYTRLKWVKADGTSGASEWPGDCDADAQVAGRNQIPTCCVFRREMWERLGGYKSRYCPQGAGEEDAEFWLRALAHGWGAKRAGEEALFLYSWRSGRVSGDKAHKETDWLSWHPWTKDGQHPFASRAKPHRWSHPVRQYDEPEVSVIIPVGPGHEGKVADALDSLEAQTFRRWEAIVVWDNQISDEWYPGVKKAYPYIRDIASAGGPGVARNAGAKIARAPLLLFLDADDYLLPPALERMTQAYYETRAAVYSDYIGMAFISDPKGLDPRLQQRIYQRDPDGWTAIGYQAAEYDCPRAQRQPELERIYTWNLVTTLLPKEWHDALGGFDESMRTWEDVDYFWRMARAGRCFTRLPEELVAYRFYTGHRRELGVELQQDGAHLDVMKRMADKYAQMETVMCSNCPQGKRQSPAPSMPFEARFQQVPATQERLQDADMVLCVYNHPNRGTHPVVGAATQLRYGYRAGGDKFLVHKEDIAVNPDLFIPEAILRPAPTPAAPVELEAPTALVKMKDETPFMERLLDDVDLAGIGPELKAKLIEAGRETVQDVADMGEDALAEFENMGRRKAATVLKYIAKRSAA